jgi:hypothetical protein
VTLSEIHAKLRKAQAKTSTGDRWSFSQVERASKWLRNGGLERLEREDAELLKARTFPTTTLTPEWRHEIKQLLPEEIKRRLLRQVLKRLLRRGRRRPRQEFVENLARVLCGRR